MITRDTLTTTAGYAAACQSAPPPLHVYDTEQVHANWHPLRRPVLAATPPGPVIVVAPMNPADLYGDDPTDPGRQCAPRAATPGMIARLNINVGSRNVAHSGVRR
jgi:hypothetical protein